MTKKRWVLGRVRTASGATRTRLFYIEGPAPFRFGAFVAKEYVEERNDLVRTHLDQPDILPDLPGMDARFRWAKRCLEEREARKKNGATAGQTR